jgi:hypothetical protein
VGSMDVGTISDELDNIIQDSFINVNLGSTFMGITGKYTNSPTMLKNGISSEFSLRSHAKGGFNKFTNSGDLILKLTESIKKSLKLIDYKINTVSGYENGELDRVMQSLEGGKFFIKISCKDDDFFRSSSTSFTTTINEMLRVITSGELFIAWDEISDKEKEEAGVTIKEGEERGNLIGKEVEDKHTSKIGVVVDDQNGKLKIVFSDDRETLELIIAGLKSEGKIKG